jgi:hypothetical protein
MSNILHVHLKCGRSCSILIMKLGNVPLCVANKWTENNLFLFLCHDLKGQVHEIITGLKWYDLIGIVPDHDGGRRK